jgi:hypothetical protein
MTDAELRDQAVSHLKKTTVGYVNKHWTTPPVGSEWDQGLKLLDQIGVVTTPPVVEPVPIVGQGYKIVFEDDFDTLDTTTWRLNPWFLAESPTSFVHTPSTVEIHCRASESYQHRGLMTRSLAWKFGYFEARMRYTRDPGSWSSHWMMSDNWIRTGNCTTLKVSEFDIFESFNGSPVTYRSHSGTLHLNTTSQCGLADQYKPNWTADVGFELADNWRVYGGLWTETDCSTYVDGKLCKTWPVWDTTNQPMRTFLTGQHHSGVTTSPADLVTEVDWFRVWQK